MFARVYYVDGVVLYWAMNANIPSPSWCMWLIPGTEDE